MTTPAHKPLRIFCSYAHEDEEYLNILRAWLRGLERQGLIEWWHDREISPGWEWEEAIDRNLRTAEVILLLVTPDFMASDYVFEKEIDRAIERHERGEARVIPIIVRPALWKRTSLDKLQALPKDARPITRWPDRDEAWLDVAEGIQKAVEELLVERQVRAAAKERYRKAVEETWVEKKLSDAEAEQLGTLASELNLSTDAADIEREVMDDTKEAILDRQEQAAREQERKVRLDELYGHARRLHQHQEWQAVVDVFEQIHAEAQDYPDPTGLLASAREALEAQERERRVAILYDRGQRHIDAEEWQQARECLEEVQRQKPGYRETEELLSQVRQKMAPPSTVEVPDLAGQEISQASTMLSEIGLRLGAQNKVPSDTVPRGQIFEQSPEVSTEIEAGSSVEVKVSSGPSTVEVPDLVGKSRSEARSTLHSANLAFGTITAAPSDDMPEGRIIKQSPVAGTKVERGSSIRITFSSEPQEATMAEPPARARADAAQTESLPSGSQVGPSTDRVEQAKPSEWRKEHMPGQRPTDRMQRVRPGDLPGTQQLQEPSPRAQVWWALALRGSMTIIIGLSFLFFLQSEINRSLGPMGFGIFLFSSGSILLFIAAMLVDSVFAIIGAIKIGGSARKWLLAEGVISGLASLVLLASSVLLLGGLAPSSASAVVWSVVAWTILIGTVRVIRAIRSEREIKSERLTIMSGSLLVLLGVILMLGTLGHWYEPAWVALILAICAMASGGMLVAFAFRVRRQREAGAAG